MAAPASLDRRETGSRKVWLTGMVDGRVRRFCSDSRTASRLRAPWRSLVVAIVLVASGPARAQDCSQALPDEALAGTMLESLPPGSAILFWGDSVTARGGDNNYAQMLVRILNSSFARFCDDGSAASSPALRVLMRGRSQRRSYREAAGLRAIVANLGPRWVVVQDAGESTPISPASGSGFGDDVRSSIDAVFEPREASSLESVVKALFLVRTPPLDEPGRDPFICKDYATACNWTAHNVVLEEIVRARTESGVVTVPADTDACTAMAVAGIDFAQDGVHPEKSGYLVYALSLLRAMGIGPEVLPEAVLVAQGLTSNEVATLRNALRGPPASPAHPRCTMDPSCEPDYLSDVSVSGSALDCLSYCEGPGSGACRQSFRGVGSCCIATGVCVDGLVAGDCPGIGDDYDFYAPVGACCDPLRGCLSSVAEAACAGGGGVYQGDGVRCAEGCCNAPGSCPVCGNGAVEGAEECDDGNRSDGDCCAWNCTREADGSTCADGIWCNGADTCAAGACSLHAGDPCAVSSAVCQGGCNEADASCDLAAGTPCLDALTCASSSCAASETCLCDGDGHCSLGALCPVCAGARRDCTDPGKSRLTMQSLDAGSGRSVSLKSQGAAPTAVPAHFGDPTVASGSGFALCVYVHQEGTAPTSGDLLWQVPFAAGELCDSARPCWSSVASRLSYLRDDGRTSLRVRIRSMGMAGRLRLSVQGSGAGLGLPEVLAIGSGQRVTVQLLTESIHPTPSGLRSRCWQETFDEGVLRSTAEVFSARTTH